MTTVQNLIDKPFRIMYGIAFCFVIFNCKGVVSNAEYLQISSNPKYIFEVKNNQPDLRGYECLIREKDFMDCHINEGIKFTVYFQTITDCKTSRMGNDRCLYIFRSYLADETGDLTENELEFVEGYYKSLLKWAKKSKVSKYIILSKKPVFAISYFDKSFGEENQIDVRASNFGIAIYGFKNKAEMLELLPEFDFSRL